MSELERSTWAFFLYHVYPFIFLQYFFFPSTSTCVNHIPCWRNTIPGAVFLFYRISIAGIERIRLQVWSSIVTTSSLEIVSLLSLFDAWLFYLMPGYKESISRKKTTLSIGFLAVLNGDSIRTFLSRPIPPIVEFPLALPFRAYLPSTLRRSPFLFG